MVFGEAETRLHPSASILRRVTRSPAQRGEHNQAAQLRPPGSVGVAAVAESAQTGELGVAPNMLVAEAKRVRLAGPRAGGHCWITHMRQSRVRGHYSNEAVAVRSELLLIPSISDAGARPVAASHAELITDRILDAVAVPGTPAEAIPRFRDSSRPASTSSC